MLLGRTYSPISRPLAAPSSIMSCATTGEGHETREIKRGEGPPNTLDGQRSVQTGVQGSLPHAVVMAFEKSGLITRLDGDLDSSGERVARREASSDSPGNWFEGDRIRQYI